MANRNVKIYFPSEIEPYMEQGHLRHVWAMLISTYWGVKRMAAVYDYGAVRKLTFVPFGGPNLWNRYVGLLIKEIEVANERNFGRDLVTEEKLAKEWQLSGQTREAVLGGQRTKPAKYADGPPDWGDKLGDGEDTPFI